MMRKCLWIIPLLLLSAAVGVPAAHADTYQYTFDLNPVIQTSTPVIFDTTGPIALGVVYPTISGSIFPFTVSTFEVTNADVLEVGGSLSSSLAAFTSITSGSEVLTDMSNLFIGTLSVTDLTPAPVPEIDPTTALSPFALLAGAAMILRGRRKRLPEPLGTSMAS